MAPQLTDARQAARNTLGKGARLRGEFRDKPNIKILKRVLDFCMTFDRAAVCNGNPNYNIHER
jgi:hypothetical protein